MKTTKLIPLSLVASAVLVTTSVAAETFLGADYHDGKNKVAFLSENVRIAGNVFLPPNYDESKNYPALVVLKSKPQVFTPRKWPKKAILP
ncbi:hypothetical protein [Vibrio jasicida]|uniref:hypothetical protein n=1 Tax=Vibrio jasicida TaxID=766224 RepID=UPI0021B467EF|nr:hypothetical protein [Vibrio jasicida]